MRGCVPCSACLLTCHAELLADVTYIAHSARHDTEAKINTVEQAIGLYLQDTGRTSYIRILQHQGQHSRLEMVSWSQLACLCITTGAGLLWASALDTSSFSTSSLYFC